MTHSDTALPYMVTKYFSSDSHIVTGVSAKVYESGMDAESPAEERIEWDGNFKIIEGIVFAESEEEAIERLEAWEHENLHPYEVFLFLEHGGTIVNPLDFPTTDYVQRPTANPHNVVVRLWSTSCEEADKEAHNILEGLGWRIDFELENKDGEIAFGVDHVAMLNDLVENSVAIDFVADFATAVVKVMGVCYNDAFETAKTLVLDRFGSLMGRRNEEDK